MLAVLNAHPKTILHTEYCQTFLLKVFKIALLENVFSFKGKYLLDFRFVLKNILGRPGFFSEMGLPKLFFQLWR